MSTWNLGNCHQVYFLLFSLETKWLIENEKLHPHSNRNQVNVECEPNMAPPQPLRNLSPCRHEWPRCWGIKTHLRATDQNPWYCYDNFYKEINNQVSLVRVNVISQIRFKLGNCACNHTRCVCHYGDKVSNNSTLKNQAIFSLHTCVLKPSYFCHFPLPHAC